MMDSIVVLDDGRIVEEGTPDELMAEDGLFARLAKLQTGGFILHDIDLLPYGKNWRASGDKPETGLLTMIFRSD